MKKTALFCIAIALLAFMPACEKFTDITPKGKNLLGNVTDLDQLLNYQFSGETALETGPVSTLVNDLYPYVTSVPNTVSLPVKTINSILLTWDEREDLAALTVSDDMYNEFYSIIGKVANPVLLMADAAKGDRKLAERLKAEAYVLRAYFHYLAVNIYAKAYNPLTAGSTGGVPYAKETDPLSTPNTKCSVQQVYDFILEDLRSARELNSLAQPPANPSRVGKAFAYAVEAKARISMHDFPGAETAASNALALQNTVEDHRDNLVPSVNMVTGMPGLFFERPELQSPEELFYASGTDILFNGLTPGLSDALGPTSIFLNRTPNLNAESFSFYGLAGIDMPFGLNIYFNASGLSTVDMYLVLAECKIRAGDIHGAMEILNNIRQKRNDPCTPLAAANKSEAFAILKQVTRTENWFGPKHFISLKRWNTEEEYKTTLRKTLLGVEYELRPDSPLWVFPFPRNATGYNPNLTPNY
jgi:hypothetical protein